MRAVNENTGDPQYVIEGPRGIITIKANQQSTSYIRDAYSNDFFHYYLEVESVWGDGPATIALSENQILEMIEAFINVRGLYKRVGE